MKLEDVKTVVSMPIALAQCKRALNKLGVAYEAAGDTAGAARALAEHPDPSKAAVAPRLAAELYGLDILMEDIEDEKHNTTRFLVMAREPADPPADAACITSFVFRVRNIPSALYKAMGGFATNGVNMLKLESYMENGVFAATMFYCEVEGRPGDRSVDMAFEELQFYSDHFQVLGAYPADPFRAAARP